MRSSRRRRPRFWLAVCNTMEAGGRGPEKGAAILRATLRAFPEAAIVGVVEAANLRDADPGWWTPYGDDRSLRLIQAERLDRAGVAAMVDADRVDVVSVRYRLGVRPFIKGRRIGMRVRWSLILRARVDGARARNYRPAHLPPPRFGRLWPIMARTIGPRSVDLADFNERPEAVSRATGKRSVIVGVLGLAMPRRWHVLEARSADVGADHRAVGAEVSPPR